MSSNYIGGSFPKSAVASSSVPAYEPPVQPVASPSFAVDLNGNIGDEVGTGEFLPTSLQCVAPPGVGEGLLGDPEDDDVEPDMIDDDSCAGGLSWTGAADGSATECDAAVNVEGGVPPMQNGQQQVSLEARADRHLKVPVCRSSDHAYGLPHPPA
ncbi:hypothetical protein Ahy_B05g075252 [Arachis hypogaea]|uniref:Uncharacterized protein n=1 Tax=Arachis hypogaea TaxID=3818 RepID=A0A444Z0T3_ARAHY|nr:hypothetical protein Ahy_B05g075252 [Arachis hypogaea]